MFQILDQTQLVFLTSLELKVKTIILAIDVRLLGHLTFGIRMGQDVSVAVGLATWSLLIMRKNLKRLQLLLHNMDHTFPLHQALVEFEDLLPNIRLACLANADDIIATHQPHAELNVDEEITKEAVHKHVNFLMMQSKLEPIINSIRRIDSYRYSKMHPNAPDRVTDADIQRAREASADWFIFQAQLCTSKPHKGICPFHTDSNASLMLMQNKGSGKLYLKCFVCNLCWDSIKFIMDRDKRTFIDAVKVVNG